MLIPHFPTPTIFPTHLISQQSRRRRLKTSSRPIMNFYMVLLSSRLLRDCNMQNHVMGTRSNLLLIDDTNQQKETMEFPALSLPHQVPDFQLLRRLHFFCPCIQCAFVSSPPSEVFGAGHGSRGNHLIPYIVVGFHGPLQKPYHLGQ